MRKTALKALGKTIVSGIIAFTILTLFCCFYENMPVRVPNEDGSTDYKWGANLFYSRATEGFAWGKTNNEGFMNMFDYDDNMKIDILIMGSSHMEAYQVDMSQSTASQLNTLLENETVYNIGISEHTFLTCVNNLRAAINKYHPKEYVIIETSRIVFSDEEIALAINEEFAELPSYFGGIIGLLQKNPYLRLIDHQRRTYKNLRERDVERANSPEAFVESDTTVNEKLLADLFQKMGVLAEEHGIKVIIVYLPSINISSDGAINVIADQGAISKFKRPCFDNGILFLDMSNRFEEEYKNAHTLPYGFFNTPIGSGHLNQYGHAMIADELYNLILEEDR